MTTPTTSVKIQQTDGIGSAPALYLGAGVGSGVLVLLVLLIGGVLKCLQSKQDPAVQTEAVYAMVNQPKQPSKQQEDTLTYSEINTARVTKKKPSSAPDEDTVTYATVKSKV
ncbi:T-cell-interacting, activating receptor on myeloid cells protein 1-like [Acipenser oxyrinchus oxyrinchus]|nr:T-cell-interacting, activating receptor on myeloid cells protein 1-like [Acipenser oxyrinchus oxyrinchus]